MKRIAASLVLMAVCSLAATVRADEVPAPPNGPAEAGLPPAFMSVIENLPEDGGKAVQTLGRQGCLVIRSVPRWESVLKKLADAGWKSPDAWKKINLDQAAFDKKTAVLLYNYGDEGDKFSCRDYSGDGEKARLGIVVSYVIYKKRGKAVNNFNFILVLVPKSKELAVTVSTFHPYNAPPNDTERDAKPEWQATFGPDAGDIVDGLRATISCDAKTVKAGQDIFVVFKLELADAAARKPGYFSHAIEKVSVWDGKYSGGYRNHAFMVQTPDGECRLLRPAEINNWGKNAPHPEAITADAPYILPGWAEGKIAKSIKGLGLDTSKPGKYVITGIYSENGRESGLADAPAALWGGDIATNTITVEVTKD